MSFPVEQFIWSEKSYTLRQFDKCFRSSLPRFVQISEGYLWKDEDIHCFACGEVFYVPFIGHQPRVLVKDTSGRLLSIPRDFKLPFCLTNKQGQEIGPPIPISILVQDFSTWGDTKKHVRLSKDSSVYFISQIWEDGAPVTESLDDAMEIINIYSERFLVAHGIVYDEIQKNRVGIPLTLPLTMSVGQGVKAVSMESHHTLLQRAEQTLKRFSKHVRTENLLEKDIMVFSDEYEDEDGYSLIKPTSFLRLSDTPSSPDVDAVMDKGRFSQIAQIDRALPPSSRHFATMRCASIPEEPFPSVSSTSSGIVSSPYDQTASPDSVFSNGRNRFFSVRSATVGRRVLGYPQPLHAEDLRYVSGPSRNQSFSESGYSEQSYASAQIMFTHLLNTSPALENGTVFSDSELVRSQHLTTRRSRCGAISDGSLGEEDGVSKKKKSKRGLKALFSFLRKSFERRRRKPKNMSVYLDPESDSSVSGSSLVTNQVVYENSVNQSNREEPGVCVSADGRHRAPQPPANVDFTLHSKHGLNRSKPAHNRPRMSIPRPQSSIYNTIRDSQLECGQAIASRPYHEVTADISESEKDVEWVTKNNYQMVQDSDSYNESQPSHSFSSNTLLGEDAEEECWSIPSYPAPCPPFGPEAQGACSKPLSPTWVESYLEPTEYANYDSTSSSDSGYQKVDSSIFRRPEDYEEMDAECPPLPCKRSDYSYATSPKLKWSSIRKKQKSVRGLERTGGRPKSKNYTPSPLREHVDMDTMKSMANVTRELFATINKPKKLKPTTPRTSQERPETTGQSAFDEELKKVLEARANRKTFENKEEICSGILSNAPSDETVSLSLPVKERLNDEHFISCISKSLVSSQSSNSMNVPKNPGFITGPDKNRMSQHSTDKKQKEALACPKKLFSRTNHTFSESSNTPPLAFIDETDTNESESRAFSDGPPIPKKCFVLGEKPQSPTFRSVFSHKQVPSPPPLRSARLLRCQSESEPQGRFRHGHATLGSKCVPPAANAESMSQPLAIAHNHHTAGRSGARRRRETDREEWTLKR